MLTSVWFVCVVTTFYTKVRILSPFLLPVALQIVTCPDPLGKGSQGVWQFFMGSPLWGRAGAQRLRGGILCISRTSDLLPMFLLKQWPPLRMQSCRFRQKRGISTSSAQCAHWAGKACECVPLPHTMVFFAAAGTMSSLHFLNLTLRNRRGTLYKDTFGCFAGWLSQKDGQRRGG